MGQLNDCSTNKDESQRSVGSQAFLNKQVVNRTTITLGTQDIRLSASEVLVVDHRADLNFALQQKRIEKPLSHQGLIYVSDGGNFSFRYIFHIYWQRKYPSNNLIEFSEPYVLVKEILDLVTKHRIKSIAFTDLYDTRSSLQKPKFLTIIFLALRHLLSAGTYPGLLEVQFSIKENYQVLLYKTVFSRVFSKKVADNPNEEFNLIESESCGSHYTALSNQPFSF